MRRRIDDRPLIWASAGMLVGGAVALVMACVAPMLRATLGASVTGTPYAVTGVVLLIGAAALLVFTARRKRVGRPRQPGQLVPGESAASAVGTPGKK